MQSVYHAIVESRTTIALAGDIEGHVCRERNQKYLNTIVVVVVVVVVCIIMIMIRLQCQ